MKKRLILPLLLCIMLLTAALTPAAAQDSSSGKPVSVNLFIDGRHIQMKVPAIIINSFTCVPIGTISRALGAKSVNWDGVTSAVQAPDLNITATAGESYIIANERYLYTPVATRIIGGELVVPVRTLAKAFGASVEWNERQRTVSVVSGEAPVKSGKEFYNSDDVLWMSRIISAEARGESLKGKIAVGNVVMNRVNSPWHPNSVYSVVFDRRSGIQFTPAYSGAIYNKPSNDCVIAAKLALDGANVVGPSLYFSSSKQSSWAARNRTTTATIGNHTFYA